MHSQTMMVRSGAPLFAQEPPKLPRRKAPSERSAIWAERAQFEQEVKVMPVDYYYEEYHVNTNPYEESVRKVLDSRRNLRVSRSPIAASMPQRRPSLLPRRRKKVLGTSPVHLEDPDLDHPSLTWFEDDYDYEVNDPTMKSKALLEKYFGKPAQPQEERQEMEQVHDADENRDKEKMKMKLEDVDAPGLAMTHQEIKAGLALRREDMDAPGLSIKEMKAGQALGIEDIDAPGLSTKELKAGQALGKEDVDAPGLSAKEMKAGLALRIEDIDAPGLSTKEMKECGLLQQEDMDVVEREEQGDTFEISMERIKSMNADWKRKRRPGALSKADSVKILAEQFEIDVKKKAHRRSKSLEDPSCYAILLKRDGSESSIVSKTDDAKEEEQEEEQQQESTQKESDARAHQIQQAAEKVSVEVNKIQSLRAKLEGLL